jgi:serine/threonine protein kinase
MASGKVTEILSNAGKNVTQRLLGGSKKTEVMRNTDNTNVTWVMENEETGGGNPVQIGTGASVAGYQVVDIISENTGEATLLLVERESVQYVLKMYHKNKTPKENLLEILDGINSEYVIHNVDKGMYYDRFFEVLPYYKNGDLLAQMPISEEEIEKVIVPCVNEGLKALHEKDIIHRDIKPSNIFLSEDRRKAIIGDFGISSVLNQDVSVRATSMSRTLGYSAPETSNGFISKESDYYSLGITVYHLVLGTDPFAGMSDMQILYQTINKKLEIPQTVSHRLQALIKGLTLKDRNDRWGYEEVCRWAKGEQVDVIEQIKKTDAEKPYTFMYDKYSDINALSLAFAQNWDNAKKHLFRGLVDKYLSTYNQEMASQCMDLKEIKDKDLAVFKLIYLLNPNAPLCFRGKLYNDLEALGLEMANSSPNIDEDIRDLVKCGALLSYVKSNLYDEKLIEAIADVTEALEQDDKSTKYFKLMFILNPSMGYQIGNARCEDVQDLIELLEGMDNTSRDNVSDVIVDDPMLMAWLDALGYGKQVEKWQQIYEKVEW